MTCDEMLLNVVEGVMDNCWCSGPIGIMDVLADHISVSHTDTAPGGLHSLEHVRSSMFQQL